MEERIILSSWKQVAKRLLVSSAIIEKLKSDLVLGKKTPTDVFADILQDWNVRLKGTKSLTRLLDELKTFPELKVVAEKIVADMDITKFATTGGKWIELNKRIQEELLLKLVTFFDNQLSLLQITEDLDEIKLREILQNHLNGQALQDFISASSYQITKSLIPTRLNYYVPRTLSLRTRISEVIFRSPSLDIFLVNGIEWSTLSLLTGDSPTDVSSNQVEHLTHRFIVLEEIEHFDRICEITSQPVHQINFQNETFTWIRSKGNLSVIHEHINGEFELYDEEKFVTECCANATRSMFCVSDTPGMGKSTLLSSIARQIQMVYKKRIVIYYHAMDWISLFTLNKQMFDTTAFIGTLSNNVALSPLGIELLKCLLEESSASMDLMLDGIDEVPIGDLENLLDHMTFIQDAFPNTRIWVSTRPHFLKLLESRFKILLINIKPFDEPNQKTVLANYWAQTNNILNTKKLENFSNICLANIKKNTSATTLEIVGTPLQCLLLADVYSSKALEYVFGMEKEIRTITSIPDLFRLYARKNYSQMLATNTKEYEAHINLALQTILQNGSYVDKPKGNDIFSSGLSGNPDTKLNFVHRTFAEFFVAEFLIQQIRSHKSVNQNLSWLHKILSLSFKTHQIGSSITFLHSALCYFFDAFLIENSIIDDSSLVALINNSLQLNYASKMSVMVASAQQKSYGIFSIIFIDIRDNKIAKLADIKFEWLTLILVVTRHANLDIITSICRHVEEIGGQDICNIEFSQWKFFNTHLTPLHVSIQRGSFKIFEYFIQKYLQIIPQIVGCVHIAVHKTQHLGQSTLQEKEQMIKYLSRKLGKKILDEKLDNGNTPLLMDEIHINLVKFLLDEGANVFSRTPNLNTLAHNSATYMSSEDFQTLMECISNNHGAAIFRHKNSLNELAIHCAIKKLNVSLEMLEFYITHIDNEDADTCVYGDTLLYHLIKFGYTGHFIEIAWSGSSKWNQNMRFWDNSTTLLHIAAEWANLDAIEYLLANNGDPNALDSEGKSPLHIVCDRKNFLADEAKLAAVEKIISTLVEYGASICVRDSFGRRPISYAFSST